LIVALLLTPKIVEKPWGRDDLAGQYGIDPNATSRIGEIWFEDPTCVDRDLLIKLLFTSQRLSIQVHPDDEAAVAAGYPRGKDEAWCVIAASPDATIGLGITASLSPTEFADAARDGTIVDLMEWREVKAGDVIYSPAGTVHAIGAGLILLEIQQNLDLTYRLYDYGRPRELHLSEGVAVSSARPYVCPAVIETISDVQSVFRGAKFTVECWAGAMAGTVRANSANPVWIIAGGSPITVDDSPVTPWSVVLCTGDTDFALPQGSQAFAAYIDPRHIAGSIARIFSYQGYA
jgi:mannose-6-phosphate isomerase